MYIADLIFFVFAALLVLAGAGVIIARNPVTSALYLVMAFVCSAVLWMLLSAEFLSLVLVFVYVGAVMTLFLFVVMMLSLQIEQLRGGFVRFLPLALIVVAVMVGLMLYAVSPQHFGQLQPQVYPADYSNTKELGSVLYTTYVYSFELAAVILLVAIVAAITLSHLGKPRRKVQSVSEQQKTKPSDRVKLVNIPTDKGYRDSPQEK